MVLNISDLAFRLFYESTLFTFNTKMQQDWQIHTQWWNSSTHQSNPLKFNLVYREEIMVNSIWDIKRTRTKQGQLKNKNAEVAIFSYVLFFFSYFIFFLFFFFISYSNSINQLIAIPYLLPYCVLFYLILICHFSNTICFVSLSVVKGPVSVLFVWVAVLVPKSVTHQFK